MALTAAGIGKQVTLPGGDTLRLLVDIDLQIAPGEAVSIMGRSGSGKTTLLSILGLLSVPDTGTVRVLGADTTAIGDRGRAQLRNQHIGFVFQSYSLIAHMSAYENVELPLLQSNRYTRRQRRDLVTAALADARIAHRAASRPRQLSGGEQQRTAIARALVTTPAVIIADEPTGALDTASADAVLSVLVGATRERGAALVLATHDTAVASRAQRTLVITHDGLADTTVDAA